WLTVRADLDYTTRTARLWLDGEIVATGIPILPKEFDDPSYGHVVLDKFGITEYNWAGGGTGVIYVDDVRICVGQTIDRRMSTSSSGDKSEAKIATGPTIGQTDQRKVTFVFRGVGRIDLLNHHNEYGKSIHKDITLEFAFGETDTGALVCLRSSKYHPLIHGWFIVCGDHLFPLRTSREGTSQKGQSFSFTLADEGGSAHGGKGESATLIYGELEKRLSSMRGRERRSLTDKLRSERAVVHDDPPVLTSKLFRFVGTSTHIYVFAMTTSTTAETHCYMGELGSMTECKITEWLCLSDGGTTSIVVKGKGSLHVPQTMFPRPGGPLPPTWQPTGSSGKVELTAVDPSSDILKLLGVPDLSPEPEICPTFREVFFPGAKTAPAKARQGKRRKSQK
ncbi:MAG: hypothetical protein ACYSW8_16905, partial [Planctomycetota bacterium]